MNGWTHATIHSVFASLLLPMELLEGRGLSGADISGILGGSNPKNSVVKVQAFVGVGTHEMGFGETEREIVFNEKKRNLAVLNGKSLSAGKENCHCGRIGFRQIHLGEAAGAALYADLRAGSVW